MHVRLEELPEFLTAEEFFKLVRIGRTTGYEALRRGDFPTIRVGKKILVPRSAIERLIQKAAQGA